jgi:hypothetical protein
MDRRDRNRLAMTTFCRLAPLKNRRRSTWKRVENISPSGMLVSWSRGESDTQLPCVGDFYTVELQLPTHPVFGQRALQFKSKVVRVFKQPNGGVMAGLESTQRRFKTIKAAGWPDHIESAVVN